MNTKFITYDQVAEKLVWTEAVEALRMGHLYPKAQIGDLFLGPSEGTLMSRGAYIEGLGYGVKSFTVFGDNPKAGLPSVQGAMMVFDSEHGRLAAIIENRLITEFKTAADSVLGAALLKKPKIKTVTIIGGGRVATSLISAYSEFFPDLRRIMVWTRQPEQSVALAIAFADNKIRVYATTGLEESVAAADIVCTTTMAKEPVLEYKWLASGTHVDLIGAYKADMREADDETISKGSLYVDSRETTIQHIGELAIPMANGIITPDSVKGDLYELINDPTCGRKSDDEITVYKNGGGAHLDLMMAKYIIKKAGK